MKTKVAKNEEIQRQWFHIDATGVPLGRLAAGVATILMGKHRPSYTPHVDTGDIVVITNVENVKLTGTKVEYKAYDHYTGYPGGLITVPVKRVLERHPDRVIYEAVRRMLPKTKMGDKMLKKLRLHVGADHPHGAHKPVTIDYKGQGSAYLAAKANKPS